MISFTQKRWQLALVFFLPIIIIFGIFSTVIYQFYISQIYYLDEEFQDASFNPFEIRADGKNNEQNNLIEIITEDDWEALSMKEIDEKLIANNQKSIGDSSDPFYDVRPEQIEKIYKKQFGEKSEDIYILGSSNEIDRIQNLPYISQSRFEETQKNIAMQSFTHILYIFFVLLIIVGGLSFFLARFTLRPIEKNMNDQKNFIANASHELKTPLALMKTEAEVLLDSQSKDLEEYKSFAKNVIQDVDSLNTLSNALLNCNVQNKSQIFKNIKSIDISSLLNDLLHKFKKRINTELKILEVNIPTKKLFAKISQEECKQLFTILLDNACKYSKKNAVINFSIEKTSDKKIKIFIFNEGKNIESSDISHVFERFYRSTVHQNNDGNGLGLSLAKEIVERNRGNIIIENIDKKGVRVEVILQSV